MLWVVGFDFCFSFMGGNEHICYWLFFISLHLCVDNVFSIKSKSANVYMLIIYIELKNMNMK